MEVFLYGSSDAVSYAPLDRNEISVVEERGKTTMVS